MFPLGEEEWRKKREEGQSLAVRMVDISWWVWWVYTVAMEKVWGNCLSSFSGNGAALQGRKWERDLMGEESKCNGDCLQ